MTTHEDLAAMRRELRDLEAALKWDDPPLADNVRNIAMAKIETLRGKILERPQPNPRYLPDAAMRTRIGLWTR